MGLGMFLIPVIGALGLPVGPEEWVMGRRNYVILTEVSESGE